MTQWAVTRAALPVICIHENEFDIFRCAFDPGDAAEFGLRLWLREAVKQSLSHGAHLRIAALIIGESLDFSATSGGHLLQTNDRPDHRDQHVTWIEANSDCSES